MKKVIFIVGPTAVGKTDLGLKLATSLNGDLVNADSVQVYRNLDIISGKDLPQNYRFKDGYYNNNGFPSIYLLDVVDSKTSFNVAQFYKTAAKVIKSIQINGKVPIVVGGTGLYVEALLNGLDKTVEPDFKLRAKLENLSTLNLQKLLKKEILNKLNDSDKNNKRRLVRAIEKESGRENKAKGQKPDYESLVIGLFCDRKALRQRIDVRVNERIKKGALDEAKSLFVNHENLAQQVKDANGYKQLFMFLKGELDYDEAIYRWKISEYHHAKNQMTWFRKYGNVEWFDIDEANFREKIKKEVQEFLL